MVSDGYWLLLAPLPPGDHVLRVGVSLLDTDQEGGTTYRLTIAEPLVAASGAGSTPEGAAALAPSTQPSRDGDRARAERL